MNDIQKASLHKRTAAYLLDLILLTIVITGVAFGLSAAFGYDSYVETLDRIYAQYEEEYGIDFDISSEDFAALSREEQEVYGDVNRLLNENEEALAAYNMTVSLAMAIASLSILSSYLFLEFAVPLILKNGQTVGKKIFGIGLIRPDGVRVTAPQLFIRTLLGKCAVETMIPAYVLILILFGNLGMTGTVILIGIAVLQIAFTASSRNHAAIHDVMAGTVAVDLASQRVFDTHEDLMAYKNKLQAEAAAKDKYIP